MGILSQLSNATVKREKELQHSYWSRVLSVSLRYIDYSQIYLINDDLEIDKAIYDDADDDNVEDNPPYFDSRTYEKKNEPLIL